MRPGSVSVAIATYNRAGLVRQAIQAALDQTLSADEIVVSDDASGDAAWQALKQIAAREPRVRIFARAANSGGVDNWNFAVRQTRGDYIAWCSDDDRFTPRHLEHSIEYLAAHPEVGLVHSGFIDVIEAGAVPETVVRPLRFPKARILTRRNLLAYLTRYYDWPFHPSTLVVRRAVWERVGKFNPCYALADTDWFVRAVEQFPAALLPNYGVYNRRHPGNWSNRLGSARMQREIFEIVEGAIDRLWPEAGLQRRMWKTIWRANVRLRLLLTLRARVKIGHGGAACAAWSVLAHGTGRRLPDPVTRAGQALIRRWCAGRAPESAGQNVSPV